MHQWFLTQLHQYFCNEMTCTCNWFGMVWQGSACEVMMLRTARRYDTETDTVIFGNGMPFTKDNLRFAGLQDYVDGMFKFCRGMGQLGVDNAEYALLTAICLFSGRLISALKNVGIGLRELSLCSSFTFQSDYVYLKS